MMMTGVRGSDAKVLRNRTMIVEYKFFEFDFNLRLFLNSVLWKEISFGGVGKVLPIVGGHLLINENCIQCFSLSQGRVWP